MRAAKRHAGHPRDVARPAFHGAGCAQDPAPRQSAGLAPSRRRDQRDCGRAARHRHHPRLGQSHGSGFVRKAGVGAFQAMLRCLAEGVRWRSPPTCRRSRASPGSASIKLAQASGRPIYPERLATSRRYVLDNWDRTTINLPFSRGAGVAAEPVSVPADADDATLEATRQLRRGQAQRGDRSARIDRPTGRRGDDCRALSRCRSHCALIKGVCCRGHRSAPRLLRGGSAAARKHAARLAERRGEAQPAAPARPAGLGCMAQASARCSPSSRWSNASARAISMCWSHPAR